MLYLFLNLTEILTQIHSKSPAPTVQCRQLNNQEGPRMFIIQQKEKKLWQIAVNTPMYTKERFKAPRDICQSTFKVTGQTPGLFGYCSSASTLIPDSGPKSALEISKEPLMSDSASLLRGCKILQHVTACFPTVGYVAQHLEGHQEQGNHSLHLLPSPYPFQITGRSKLILSGGFCEFREL